MVWSRERLANIGDDIDIDIDIDFDDEYDDAVFIVDVDRISMTFKTQVLFPS